MRFTPGRSCRCLVLAAVAACGARDPVAIPAPGEGMGSTGGRTGTAGSGGASGSGGSGAVDAGPGDTGAAADAASAALALTGFHPKSGARATAATLMLVGRGFPVEATVLFDGQPVPTVRRSAGALEATIAASLTADVGYHSLQVSAGGTGPRSSVGYYTIAAPPGWPEVIDFSPDNGSPGDVIRVVGFNLSGEALKMTDSAGHQATTGRIGTIGGNNVVLETAELTVPADWKSGPLRVSTALGSFRGKVFTVGKNLALLPGVKATASSEYGGTWTVARGADNDLFTSWFTAAGDCVSKDGCKTPPWFMITFPAAQTVARIALRGSREYASGYDFLRARFELLGEGGAVLHSETHELLEPDRDLDVVLPAPLEKVTAVRFHSEADESEDPGFGELGVFGE